MKKLSTTVGSIRKRPSRCCTSLASCLYFTAVCNSQTPSLSSPLSSNTLLSLLNMLIPLYSPRTCGKLPSKTGSIWCAAIHSSSCILNPIFVCELSVSVVQMMSGKVLIYASLSMQMYVWNLSCDWHHIPNNLHFITGFIVCLFESVCRDKEDLLSLNSIDISLR